MNISDIVRLSELLGEMGSVRRMTKLPNGEQESDSHHSFSLALIAYQICVKECPELDVGKVVLFALAHDLLEIVTGDEDSLHLTKEQMAAKHEREKQALGEFNALFQDYPEIKTAMHNYEKLDTVEAATVFVLDKACTTWSHHADNAKHAREFRSIKTKADVEGWADRQRVKFMTRLKVMPPKRILEIYEESFEALKALYDN